jgi:hypothetical protein
MKRKHCNHVISFVPYKKAGPYSWNSLPTPKRKRDCPISPQFLRTLTLIILFLENLKNSKYFFSKEQNFVKGNKESFEIFWDVLVSTWNLQN